MTQPSDEANLPNDMTRLARDVHRPSPAADHAYATTEVVSSDYDDTVPDALAGQLKVPRKAEEPNLALPVGYRLHEYRVDKVLGQGGFGITYLASDVNLNAKVAIKEYLPEHVACRSSDVTVTPRSSDLEETYGKGLESYLVEARTLATFRHPHIVRVARFFEANSTAYMVLEYERGESLKAWCLTHANLPEIEILTLFGPLLDGLAVVHEAGFLHRDIKPDNIYVRDLDGALVLLDFGAARRTSDEPTDGSNVVTPGYGPIEQYGVGEQGPWTDLYALGATLYWMIAGRKPVAAPERMVEHDPLKPAVDVGKGRYSEAFLKAIDWALKPETRDRPRDIAEFRTAFFAGHPESLDLQSALSLGGAEAADDGWAAVLRSPRLLRGKLARAVTRVARPASWPLAIKMTIAMVLAALMPMTITAYYNYEQSVARVSAGEMRNLEQLANSVAGRVSQLIGDSRSLAVYVSNDNELVEFLKEPSDARKASILSKLEALVKANRDIDVATVLDVDGTALTSTGVNVAGLNFRFRRYFQEAVEGRPFISGIIVGATLGNAGAFFANPVRDESGKVIGVVTIRISASAIAAILEESRGVSEHYAMLVDEDGIILHHSDPRLIFKSLAPLSPETLKAIVTDKRFRLDKIEALNLPELASKVVGTKAQGNTGFVSPVNGLPAIGGFAPVAGHNWVVTMSESREYFEAPLRAIFRTVIYSVGAVGLVFLVLAVWFSRTIIRPIEQLTAAAHALKSADYDNATVRVMAMDEIGQFARVFNVMIDVLRQREREQGGRNRRKTKGAPPGI